VPVLRSPAARLRRPGQPCAVRPDRGQPARSGAAGWTAAR